MICEPQISAILAHNMAAIKPHRLPGNFSGNIFATYIFHENYIRLIRSKMLELIDSCTTQTRAWLFCKFLISQHIAMLKITIRCIQSLLLISWLVFSMFGWKYIGLRLLTLSSNTKQEYYHVVIAIRPGTVVFIKSDNLSIKHVLWHLSFSLIIDYNVMQEKS